MSYNNGNSPSHGYGGFEGDPLMEAYNNARFSQEISDKMKVPKRIAANGYEIDHDLMNTNNITSWNSNEKFDMTVPDRIVVIGQDQHLVMTGTKSAPREIVLENSILPKENRGQTRVQTPPRVITLDQHYFPSASDDLENEDENPDEVHFYEQQRQPDFYDENNKKNMKLNRMSQNMHEIVINPREATPYGSGVGSVENLSTAHDEVLHLRKQVSKLNRRLLNVEIDNLQRTQREKVVCVLGVAYFVVKMLMWLNHK